MLTGEYQHNMDLKGRVTVPSKFREDLGDKFYVCKGLDGCLFLLSQAQWDKLVEKVSAIPLAQGKGIQRYFFSGAAEFIGPLSRFLGHSQQNDLQYKIRNAVVNQTGPGKGHQDIGKKGGMPQNYDSRRQRKQSKDQAQPPFGVAKPPEPEGRRKIARPMNEHDDGQQHGNHLLHRVGK